MKRYLLIIALSFVISPLFSQNNSVAVDDEINFKMGDIITFNPLINDYNTAGEDIQIFSCRVLSFTWRKNHTRNETDD